MKASRRMPTLRHLDDVVRMVRSVPRLYVRWSRGPGDDLRSAWASRDALTGVPLPGLSANPMAVADWWGDRSVRLWVARKLHDYRHLRENPGPDVRPWLLIGTPTGRGPDNEPLVTCERPLAWVGEAALTEARQLLDEVDEGEGLRPVSGPR